MPSLKRRHLLAAGAAGAALAAVDGLLPGEAAADETSRNANVQYVTSPAHGATRVPPDRVISVYYPFVKPGDSTEPIPDAEPSSYRPRLERVSADGGTTAVEAAAPIWMPRQRGYSLVPKEPLPDGDYLLRVGPTHVSEFQVDSSGAEEQLYSGASGRGITPAAGWLDEGLTIEIQGARSYDLTVTYRRNGVPERSVTGTVPGSEPFLLASLVRVANNQRSRCTARRR